MKNFVERRSAERYEATIGTMAILHNSMKAQGHIIDISKGGLLLYCPDYENEPSDNISELDILLKDEAYFLKNLSVEPVLETNIPNGCSLFPTRMKKKSLKFRDLTPSQLTELEYFIMYKTTYKTKFNFAA